MLLQAGGSAFASVDATPRLRFGCLSGALKTIHLDQLLGPMGCGEGHAHRLKQPLEDRLPRIGDPTLDPIEQLVK